MSKSRLFAVNPVTAQIGNPVLIFVLHHSKAARLNIPEGPYYPQRLLGHGTLGRLKKRTIKFQIRSCEAFYQRIECCLILIAIVYSDFMFLRPCEPTSNILLGGAYTTPSTRASQFQQFAWTNVYGCLVL